MSWLSKALNISKKHGTGIYSWGKSDAAKSLVGGIPGVGGIAVASMEALSEGSDTYRKELESAANQAPGVSDYQLPGIPSEMDPKMLIALGIGAYYLFGKK